MRIEDIIPNLYLNAKNAKKAFVETAIVKQLPASNLQHLLRVSESPARLSKYNCSGGSMCVRT